MTIDRSPMPVYDELFDTAAKVPDAELVVELREHEETATRPWLVIRRGSDGVVAHEQPADCGLEAAAQAIRAELQGSAQT